MLNTPLLHPDILRILATAGHHSLVLIAYGLGRTGELSVLGAELFLASRLAIAVLYIAGVRYLRTLAYFGGLVGMVLIVVQLLTG